MTEKYDVVDAPLNNLAVASFNPRTISKDQFEQLKHSMQHDPDMLRARPVIALPNGTVIAGNMRVRAAEALGWPSIPTIFVDLDDVRAREWMIRDNNQYGEWQEDDLSALLYSLRESGADLTTVGFTNREVAHYLELAGIGGKEHEQEHTQNLDETAEGMRAKWGIESGQIWEIPSDMTPGKSHRIICGDSTKIDVVGELMNHQQAMMMATDPPYAMSYDGGNHPQNWAGAFEGDKTTHKEWDDLTPEQAIAFYCSVIETALSVMHPRAPIYMWFAGTQMKTILEAWDQTGLLFHQMIIWKKNQSTPTRSHYMWSQEPCLYGWVKGNQPEITRRPPADAKSTWEIDVLGTAKLHPTQKPTEIFSKPILYHTLPGEIVYEPFAGSGTQLVAAEEQGRICYAAELDPAYTAIVLQRLSEIGLHPKRVE